MSKCLLGLLAGLPLLADALSFEPLPRGASYLSRGPGYSFELSARQAVLKIAGSIVRLSFADANPGAKLSPQAVLETRVNYLFGNDPAQWRRNVPTFARLHVAGLYPGVDLVYYGNQHQLEYDLVLAPGADPSPLLLDFDGISSLRLASDGALLLATSAGELRWQRPIAYQVIDGKRRPVDCVYRVRTGHQVGFEIGSYDRSLPLTIDPTFEYSTALPDVQVHALQVDGFGQTYVAGYSPNGLTGGNDIYVSKLNNAGTSAFFTTYLGGRGDDRALGLALDYAGSIHLTGRTNSPNFPVVGARQSTLGGDYDAFLVKLTPGGDQITFSTYHGGSGYDSSVAVAINPVDNSIFIAGSTDSSDFPVRNALQPVKSSSTDGFVTRFTANGAGQMFSTYLGGTGIDSIAALKVNAAGQAWVAGASNSREVFAAPNAFQRNNAGGVDCLVTGLTFDGSARAYSSYFGGTGTDTCTGLDLTAEGNVVVTGSTDSVDLPLLSPTQAALGGATDIFVAELGPTSALVFSTYLGGPRLDQANAVAVDVSGTIHLAGESTGELPVLNAVSAERAGSPAALLRSPNSNSLFSQSAPGFGAETSIGVLAFQSAQVVYAGSASGRLYRSLDTGANWLPIPTPLPVPIRFLAFSGPNLLLAGTSQGLYFSTDQGVSWALRHPGPNVVGLAVNSANNAFYLALSNGFFRSNDLGRTWVPTLGATAQALAIDPIDPFRLYLATPTALLRSSDGGTTWAAVSSQAFTQIVPTAMAQIYGVSNGRLFSSSNAGQSWAAVLFPIADAVVRVAVDPSESRLLLAATTATGLWRSLDRGVSWAAASTADSSPLDVVFAPNGSALASFSVTPDAVLARWGRLRTAGSSRYTYYQASVTYLGGDLADVGRAVAADVNTVGTYIAGQSPAGAFVTRLAPSPVGCTYQVAPRDRIVLPSPEGGAGVLRVLAPSGCPWTVSASDPWLVTNAAVNRAGTGEVRFFALANLNALNRSGTLSIAGTTVSVEQAGANCSTGVSLSNAGNSLFSPGAILYPTLNIGPSCGWTADTAAPWIALPSASGTGPGTVPVMVAQNFTPFPRSSLVRIGPVSFTVYQASRCFVTLSPAILALPGTSSSGQFEVRTGEDCSWSLASTDPAITITSPAAGIGPSLVWYTIAANPAASSRTLTITGGTVALTIVQNGGSSCTFLIDTAPRSFSPLAATGTVSVTTQANCVRPAFSDQPWLTLSGTTQTGSGNLGFSLGSNATSARRTANLSLDGRMIPFTQEGLSTQAPVVFAPVPASGSGVAQTFSFQFAVGNGATNLEVLNVLINSALDARNACYLAYVRSSGVLYLVPDSGEGLLSGNLTNSQCAVDPVSTTVAVSGNLISLTLRLTFSAAFAGNKVIYQAAANRSGTNSNWTALGVWNVPSSALTASSAPIVSSFSPARSTGSRQTFSMTITRADGIAELNVVNLLINNALDGRNACYLAYVWPSKTLYLVPDSGAGLLLPGGLDNSQCRIPAPGISATSTATALTLTLPIEFKAGAFRDRLIYGAARDLAGNNSGWQVVGSVSVQ